MRKKRLVNVLTSAALTAAMVMSMGMTAMADSELSYSPFTSASTTSETAGEVGTITKTVYKPADVYAPDTSYSFEYAYVEELTSANLNGATPSSGALYVSGDNTTITTTSSENSGTGTSITYTDTLTVYADVTKFPQVAGSYVFAVKETIPSESDKIEGMSYSEKIYYIIVDIGYAYDSTTETYDDGLSVLYAKFTTKNDNGSYSSEGKADSADFGNGYGTDSDPVDPNEPGTNGTVNNLKITKTTDGNAVYAGDTYSFTITVTSSNTEDGFVYQIFDSNGGAKAGDDNRNVLTGSNGIYSVTLTLSADEYVVVYGLSSKDSYSVSESDATSSDKGYITQITTVPLTGATTVEGSTTDMTQTDKVTSGSVIPAESQTELATQTVTYLNTKNITTPTGIILNFAPYILLVAFAGVFAVLFLGKKKEKF